MLLFPMILLYQPAWPFLTGISLATTRFPYVLFEEICWENIDFAAHDFFCWWTYSSSNRNLLGSLCFGIPWNQFFRDSFIILLLGLCHWSNLLDRTCMVPLPFRLLECPWRLESIARPLFSSIIYYVYVHRLLAGACEWTRTPTIAAAGGGDAGLPIDDMLSADRTTGWRSGFIAETKHSVVALCHHSRSLWSLWSSDSRALLYFLTAGMMSRRHDGIRKALGAGVYYTRSIFTQSGCYINYAGITQESLVNIQRDFLLVPEIISQKEEHILQQEIGPLFRKFKYEDTHIDHVISQYRELLVSWERLNGEGSKLPCLRGICQERLIPIIKKRLHECDEAASSSPGPPLLPLHILDIANGGYIGPHVDNVEYSGRFVAALSLLSNRLIRFRHITRKHDSIDVLIPNRSFYLQKDSLRYEYTHEVMMSAMAFEEASRSTERRISILFRDPPTHGKG